MMHTPVQVTQADRKAAAAAYNELYGRSNAALVTAEDMAGDWLARRFAAHRLAAIEEAAEAVTSYCRGMNARRKEASFTDAVRAIRNLTGETA